MKQISILILTIICQLTTINLFAQSKTDQIKQIRQIYAKAKQDVAQNGKGGSVPLDIRIDRIETDTEADIEEDEELQFFFKRPNNGLSVCYLITRNWTANGHTDYREYLFDPVKGHLLFAFMKAETHAGFKVETRYYYDATGRCIEQKHKVQDQEATADAHSWNDANSEKESATRYISISKGLLDTYNYPTIAAKPSPAATPKAQTIKNIRAAYAEAKNKCAQNDKKDGAKNEVVIVVHDQAEQDMPPLTATLKYYYDVIQKESTYYHCYFLSEKRKSMYADTYEEYLTDNTPERHNLIFNYCHSVGEGENLETRYYYDANGHCIEAKSNVEDYDDRIPTRNRAGHYFSLFDTLLK